MSVSPAEFKAALGRWPSGVTIVTARSVRGPAGLTVSAFFSVSLRPPLVGVCLDRQSETLPIILEQRRFAINVLASDQSALSDRFAMADERIRFDGVELLDAPGSRSPFLAGAVAQLDCDLDAAHDAGDHVLCIGRIALALAHAGAPLVYQGSRYQQLAPLAPPHE